MSNTPLRIVTFNFLPIAFNLASQWIQSNGHKHVLAVTTPGPLSRPTPQYKGIVENAPRHVDVLVTTRLRTVATPLIRALEPDLIVCFSFPYRITPELCAIPRYGAVNLHPAVLPAYRGPNVFRPFYDGAPEFGATLHWIAEEYDTGNILSQRSAPMPEEVTVNSIFPIWGPLMGQTLAEGIGRALAGDPGSVQDDSGATYAAPFTEEEMWLDLSEPQRVLQRKMTALSFAGAGQVKVTVENESFIVMALALLPVQESVAKPGDCVQKGENSLVVQVADGLVRLQVEPLSKEG
jgi:methionyl-tRNA formyltransferase